jgi:dCTP deaminase
MFPQNSCGPLNDFELDDLSRDAIERDSGGSLHVGPSSLDLHLAPEKVVVEGGGRGTPRTDYTQFDVSEEESHPETTRYEDQEWVTVAPNEFCLGRTDERLDLPPGVMALMHGRSSVGRLGLFVENAGLVDRGFEGTLTLELYNPTENHIDVPAQTRVAQLVFFEQGGEAHTAYDGKYQGQEDATASRLYDDQET